MKITGIKSICCGGGVTTRKKDAWKVDDKLYICHKCRKPCDAYFTCEIIPKAETKQST